MTTASFFFEGGGGVCLVIAQAIGFPDTHLKLLDPLVAQRSEHPLGDRSGCCLKQTDCDFSQIGKGLQVINLFIIYKCRQVYHSHIITNGRDIIANVNNLSPF